MSFLYYFYEVGLWGYLYRRYCPQIITPPPPPVPDINGQGQENAPNGPDNLARFRHPQPPNDARWGLGRLLQLLQTPPGIPRGTGPALDVMALLVSFVCSLFPS